jgi:hypothetical protein
MESYPHCPGSLSKPSVRTGQTHCRRSRTYAHHRVDKVRMAQFRHFSGLDTWHLLDVLGAAEESKCLSAARGHHSRSPISGDGRLADSRTATNGRVVDIATRRRVARSH